MSGKHAMPSAWRLSPVGPVVTAAVVLVVWVAIAGSLLLSPEPPVARVDGSDGSTADPYAPEESAARDSSSAVDPSPSGSPSGTATPAGPRKAEASAERSPAQQRPMPASSSSAEPSEAIPEPTQAAPAQSAPAESGAGQDDNPGKKKGHDKAHGPHGHQP